MNDFVVSLRVVDVVDALHVIGGAEGRDDERLRLAAREERRAVRPREHRRVDGDVAHDVRLAAVDAEAGGEHLRAQRVVLEIADDHADEAVRAGSGTRRQLGLHLFLDLPRRPGCACALSFWLIAASMRFSAALVTVFLTSAGISVLPSTPSSRRAGLLEQLVLHRDDLA
jgi:hypothetical protein